MRFSRVGVVASMLLSAAVVAGCGEKEPQAPGDPVVAEKTWQVMGIYTSAQAPSIIPDRVVPAPIMSFGNSGLVGDTGCARFIAQVTYHQGDERAHVSEADSLHIDSMKLDDARPGCAGENLWAHNQLTRLLREGYDFDMQVDPNNQLVLRLRDGRVDSPAIRLVSLSI